MSRNLCNGDLCEFCGERVKLVETRRRIRPEEAGIYYDEFKDGWFANAECYLCLGQYIAWVREYDNSIYDLSFRSTFNDEAGDADMPKYKVMKCRAGLYKS